MKALPANRVFLILGIIYTAASAAAVFVAGVTNSLPKAWAPAVTVIVVVLGAVAAVTAKVITFLKGDNKSEALQAQARQSGSASAQISPSRRATVAGAWPYDRPASAASEPAPASEPATEVVSVDRLPLDALHSPNPFNSGAAGFPDPGDQKPAPEPPATEAVQA